MNSNVSLKAKCSCPSTGAVHAAGCGCQRAEEFIAAPTAAYLESRRVFLRRVVIGGLTVAALPLLQSEAEADLFKPSVADQKKLGDQAAQQVLQKYREVKDSRA